MKLKTRIHLWLTGRRIRRLKINGNGGFAYVKRAHVIEGGKPLTDAELQKLTE